MIEHITKPEIIVSILKMEDKGFDDLAVNPIGISKAEWVQSLIRKISADPNGDFYRIYGKVVDGQIVAYVCVANCMDPPLSRTFIINYQAHDPSLSEEDKIDALEAVKGWAKSMGAANITIMLNTELQARYYQRFGFKRTENIFMIMEL